ncbi:MAG: hypothetical protein K0R39_4656 [Symbiobacteriaceae bacterium]|jgi:ABC-2 type transport system permease protein|nr:hypothetical protein [Symbiobacteriaceae bacterium]
MNIMPMLSKELKELARSYKLLFVPLAFVLLGLTQPVTYKMLPQLMKSASNLPPGAVIDIPLPPAGDVVAMALGQFNQLGILILVLVAMGAVAGERATGVAATVLTKPVGRGAYLGAKAIAYGLLAVVSGVLGMAAAAYYTQVLIGAINWTDAAVGTVLYLPNLLLAVALALCCSTFMKTPLAAGGVGLAGVVVLNMVPKYLGKFVAGAYPGALTEAASKAIAGQEFAPGRPVTGVLLVALLALVAGWAVLKRQEI